MGLAAVQNPGQNVMQAQHGNEKNRKDPGDPCRGGKQPREREPARSRAICEPRCSRDRKQRRGKHQRSVPGDAGGVERPTACDRQASDLQRMQPRDHAEGQQQRQPDDAGEAQGAALII